MIYETNRNKITYLRFIMALSIVWAHAYNVEVYNLQSCGVGGGYTCLRDLPTA